LGILRDTLFFAQININDLMPSKNSLYKFGGVEYDLNSRTHIMGILNVTPDSFSDGGKFYRVEKAVEHGLRMIYEGADFIDVGGESTRPGAEPITAEEEISRVLPVIEKLVKSIKNPISIDTWKSSVAERALDAGATIVNDISGLCFDKRMVDVTAIHKASVILMHIKGSPKTMQTDPVYENIIEEICIDFQKKIQIAQNRGIHQMFIDPGIGFGKTVEHNLQIIKNLRSFESFGYPIMIGPSRKSFIGKILDLPVDERLEGTAGASAVAIMNGANILRVHDVKEIKRVAQIVDAILRD
jgi:dihydropteroate synthase